jgi:hypothetical protein
MTAKSLKSSKDTTKKDNHGKRIGVFNTVSMGTTYFGFAAALWSSNQISDKNVFSFAIITTIISGAFFIAVFSKHLLIAISNKWVAGPLISFTGFILTIGFILGWLQTILQTSGIPLMVVAYIGFGWIIVLLLIMVRDAKKQPSRRKKGIVSTILKIRPYLSYFFCVVFLGFACKKFFNHDVWNVDFWNNADFWSGVYSIVIAGLILSVARGWLKVHGEIYEFPDSHVSK